MNKKMYSNPEFRGCMHDILSICGEVSINVAGDAVHQEIFKWCPACGAIRIHDVWRYPQVLEDTREVLAHVQPPCVICSPYSQGADKAPAATRIAYLDHEGSSRKWYFCDKHDFTSTINGRGFHVADFQSDFGVKGWPPSNVIWVDLPHATALRRLGGIFRNP